MSLLEIFRPPPETRGTFKLACNLRELELGVSEFFTVWYLQIFIDCRCQCWEVCVTSVYTIVLPCYYHLKDVLLCVCSLSLCHTREFTSARWSGSSPLQNYGFTSHSGRGICLEVQIWYLLAGMTQQLVSEWARIALRVQITRLWSLLPNMRL